MSRSDPQAFYLALEQSPGDPVTRQALADWYEDENQLDNAACLRFLVRKGLYPFRYHAEAGLAVTSATFKEGWFWWATDDPYYGSGWGLPPSCRLPRKLWKKLRNPFDHPVSVFKHYETTQAAYEALFDAWPLVPPAERERSS